MSAGNPPVSMLLPGCGLIPATMSSPAAKCFVRTDVAEGTRLAEDGFVLPSLQAAIEELGHRFSRAAETLVARPPTLYEADLLEVPGEWVVQILRVSVSTDDVPIHALETVCAASRHVFTIGQVAGSDQF